MTHPRRQIFTTLSIAFTTLLAAPLCAHDDHPPVEPVRAAPMVIELNPAVRAAIDDPALHPDERARLRINHGVWHPEDLIAPDHRAVIALNAWRVVDSVFADPVTDPRMRAEALLIAGECERALNILGDNASPYAIRLRATALEDMGRYAEALAESQRVDQLLESADLQDPDVITEIVRILIIRARHEAISADTHHRMITLLNRAHQTLDRLHWPARLAEAELLLTRHNEDDAVDALQEVLALNPRCVAAWDRLARLALDARNADRALAMISAIQRVRADHPAAALLLAELHLMKDDPEEALRHLEPVLHRWPGCRRALELNAAIAAVMWDDAALQDALVAYETHVPDGAGAHYRAGVALSRRYQHASAERMLREAMRRAPQWVEPMAELALMLMHDDRDDEARVLMKRVVALDPFNVRAVNTLALLDELEGYARYDTEHFTVRCRRGEDEVVAALMVEELERLHAEVVQRFHFAPSQRTLIELMPDRMHMGVRLTGLPRAGTIAACCGPVIVMEAPRSGQSAHHFGTFDWPRVLRHEYAHTVTLELTGFHIPRWLTEAAAVDIERAPRAYGDYRMLAASTRDGMLFDLDDINQAFRRPRKRGDTHKGYQQGDWMLKFIEDQWGWPAALALFEAFGEGDREPAAFRRALGVSRAEFHRRFLPWADTHARSWGFNHEPSVDDLKRELAMIDPERAETMRVRKQKALDSLVTRMTNRIGAPGTPGSGPLAARHWPDDAVHDIEIDDAQLERWINQYPDHPDLLEMQLRRRLDADPDALPDLLDDLKRYAELRPVDPWPHKQLAQFYLAHGPRSAALPHLEFIAGSEWRSPVYVRALARLNRELGRTDDALRWAQRAAATHPYDPAWREEAAAIAIESARLDLARTHIHALVILEPEEPHHQKRLERIDAMIEQRADAS